MRARMLAFSVVLSLAALSATYAQLAEAGALAKNGKWEVSVDYEPEVLPDSVLPLENYSLPGGTIESLRYVPLNNAVVLTVSGLRTNDLYSITIENLRRTNNDPIPPVTVGFSAKPISWAAIGRQEFGFQAIAVAVGETGFDLVSGGSQMRDEYDESTFAYEQATGNFDKKVRIQGQEPSSVEAAAGLMVREALDEFRDRPVDPTDPSSAFSRFLQVAVNPIRTAYTNDSGVVPANNQFQITFRAQAGFAERLEITNNVPAGSNTWVRLRRAGDLFEAFRGSDGTNWIRLGSFTFPTNNFDGSPLPKFSNTAFVGPNYAPEVGNIPESSGARRAFIAAFREYGDTGLVAADPPTLTIVRIGNQVEVAWTPGGGTLQSTTNLVTGPWIDLPGFSTARVPADRPYEFFRVRVP